ncbi:MAG TPA: peptidoglycan-binding protein [Tissierellia bacterium]|jgi:peptidoglycan hydrolase-like protein with peptidoglycan-binding domain|nr:peptidoglycan-binding protein [Tissierellia bacterium]
MNNTDTSKMILELQNYLINIRNLHPAIPPVHPTGMYDTDTKNAVSKFQKIMRLPVTGAVDILTWNAIISENKRYLADRELPKKIPVSTYDFKDVKLGDKRDIVYAIRIMLNHFRKRYANYKELEITNIYDEELEEAVKLFQKRSMLPVTGIVDKNTWNSLVTIYDACKFYHDH